MPFIFRNSAQWAMASLFFRFLDHTQRRITIARTPLDEWWARRSDLYLTTHNTQHSQQRDIHAPGEIRTHNLSRRAAADQRLRPCGHWDRLICSFIPICFHSLHKETANARPYLSVYFTFNPIVTREPVWGKFLQEYGGGALFFCGRPLAHA